MLLVGVTAGHNGAERDGTGLFFSRFFLFLRGVGAEGGHVH